MGRNEMPRELMVMSFSTSYTFGTTVPLPLSEARARVIEALAAEGFGVLTEIDVAATLKSKLGVDRRPYLILGACNPPLAHRALEESPSVGALLPCNVVVRAEGTGTVVEAMNPAAAMDTLLAPGLADVAAEATARLRRVIEALEPVAAREGSR